MTGRTVEGCVMPSACEAATPVPVGPGPNQNAFANEIAEAEA